MKRLSLAVVLLATAASVARAQDGAPGGQELFFYGKDGPVLLRVQVEVDGQPIQKTFRDYLKHWFAFYDRDGDGHLNARELHYMPGSQYLTNTFRYGNVFFAPGYGMKMSDFGKAADGRVSLAEMEDHLAKWAITPVQPVAGSAVYTSAKSPFNEMLFGLLDSDKDDKLSKKELAAARNFLKKYDLNDDELVTLQEVTGSTNPYAYSGIKIVPPAPASGYGGAPGLNYSTSLPLYLVQPKAVSQMAAMIMSRYDKDKDYKLDRAESGLAKALFDKLDRDGTGSLTITEVMSWTRVVPAIPVTLRIGEVKGNQPVVSVDLPAAQLPRNVTVGQSSGGVTYLMLDNSKVSFIGIDGPRPAAGMKAMAANNYLSFQFKQANAQKKAFLVINDLQANQFKQLASAFDMLDRNGDARLTEAEVEDFIDLTGRAKLAYAGVRVSEENQDLFKVLDVNQDGKLSLRETLSVWDNIAVLDRNEDGFLTPDEFSQQYTVTVGYGTANLYVPNQGNPLAMPVQPKANKTGPAWFQKMDFNGDGDVSEREFLGTPEQFRKLDANGDTLIDAQEAERGTALLAPKK